MKWKSGKDHPKSVVIADFSESVQISRVFKGAVETKGVVGTAGWAPPEQWLGQFMKW